MLGEAIEAGRTRIVVDLTDTTFLDSTALGVLIGAVKRLRSRDGVLTIVNIDPNIAKTFEITGLDQIFTIRPTRDEAIEALDADEADRLTRPSGDQVEDGLLDRPLDRRRVVVLGDQRQRAARSSAVVVAVEDPRVDVGGARDRRRVAEVVGDLLDGARDRPLARRSSCRRPRRDRERDGGEHGRAPRPEVLGGDVVAGGLLEVDVDVAGLDVDPAPALACRPAARRRRRGAA